MSKTAIRYREKAFVKPEDTWKYPKKTARVEPEMFDYMRPEILEFLKESIGLEFVKIRKYGNTVYTDTPNKRKPNMVI